MNFANIPEEFLLVELGEDDQDQDQDQDQDDSQPIVADQPLVDDQPKEGDRKGESSDSEANMGGFGSPEIKAATALKLH